jgi:hypothetical protein
MRVGRVRGVRRRAKLQKKWRYQIKPEGNAIKSAGPIPPGLPTVHKISNGTISLGQSRVSHESIPTAQKRKRVAGERPGVRPAGSEERRLRIRIDMAASTRSSIRCSAARAKNKVKPSEGLPKVRKSLGAMQARYSTGKEPRSCKSRPAASRNALNEGVGDAVINDVVAEEASEGRWDMLISRLPIVNRSTILGLWKS